MDEMNEAMQIEFKKCNFLGSIATRHSNQRQVYPHLSSLRIAEKFWNNGGRAYYRLVCATYVSQKMGLW